MSYTRYDAMADEAQEKYDEGVGAELETLTRPITDRIENMDADAHYPHPWTYDRHLLEVWIEDEDALQELLEEEYRDEAEEAYKDSYESGPCCNDFSCPCGNTNNYPG